VVAHLFLSQLSPNTNNAKMIVEDPPVPLSIPPLPPHFTSSLPSSPTILLSPSSPPFPSIHLPLESESESKAEKKASNKKLRESLLLLDSRLAELETIGKNRSNEGGAIDVSSLFRKTYHVS
jgi:hypothetical protein